MFPGAGQALADSGPANGGQSATGSAFPAAKGEAGSSDPGRPAAAARPKTGVPPWEITDSFLAVPPAEASGPPTAGARPPVPGQAPAERPGAGSGDPADSTESFPAVDSGAGQRSFPGSEAGDSTESFPALRSRPHMEDAFRLFPPMHGNDQPPDADGQD